MHDLKRIKDLLAQQADLTAHFEELDAVLDTYKTLRSRQEFIPQEINTQIRSKLTEIQSSQDTFLSGYEALDFGETPASVSACKAELDDYETYIIEKSSYVNVIHFILSLTSDNAAANAALDQHKAFAAAYDCRSNSVEQCEKDLKKYILLKKAFEEQDPTKRLSDIIELSPLIDFPLVVALNTNALVLSGASSAPVQSEPQTAPVRSEAPSAAEKEAPAAVSEPVQTRTAAPAADSVPAEPAVQPKNETAEPAVQPKNDAAADLLSEPDEFWTPGAKFPMPDFTVPQKPISNRPAPDEAPVSHQGIESGLNAELTQVLSRETAAASIAAGVEHTASLPNAGHAASSNTIHDPWGNIGIYNPTAVCYSVPDDCMQVFRCERPKKFSVSDFQKELSLKSKNRFQKQCAIKDAYKYGATSPHMLANLIKEDPDLVKDACDTLVDNGYLKAFELSGPAFNNFERLYVLTASGRKVFTHSETASLLNTAAVEKAATPPFASHANAVLNRQLFLKSKNLMELYMPSRQFNVGSFILETNSFINFFPTTDGSGTYAYVSALGKEVKDYLIFKIELQEMLPSLNTITAVGMNREHAKALASWIGSSFEKELAGKKLQYYSYGDDSYYSYPDGVPFRV